jgi:hypothetical protein
MKVNMMLLGDSGDQGMSTTFTSGIMVHSREQEAADSEATEAFLGLRSKAR